MTFELKYLTTHIILLSLTNEPSACKFVEYTDGCNPSSCTSLDLSICTVDDISGFSLHFVDVDCCWVAGGRKAETRSVGPLLAKYSMALRRSCPQRWRTSCRTESFVPGNSRDSVSTDAWDIVVGDLLLVESVGVMDGEWCRGFSDVSSSCDFLNGKLKFKNSH